MRHHRSALRNYRDEAWRIAANIAELPGCGTTSDADRAWAILFRQNNLRWPSTTARYQRVWTLKTYGRLSPPTGVAETVQRFGGFVAKYMGDGVLGDRGKRNGARKLARSGLDWLTEGP